MAGVVTLTGCGLDVSALTEALLTQSEDEDDVDQDEDDDDDRDDEDEDKDKDDEDKDDEDKDSEDPEALFQKFLDGELEAHSIDYQGNAVTYKYTDLQTDPDEWDSYYYDDDSYIDVDNDGENELHLYGPYGGKVLDVRDGEIYDLTEGEGTAGELCFGEYEGLTYICHRDVSHAGRQIHLFDRYENGEIVESFELNAEYWENTFDSYDRDSDFTFKGEKITMTEYEALAKEILGYRTKVEVAQIWAEYEAENFDYTREKIVNDGSDAFFAKVDECVGDYYYPTNTRNDIDGTLSIRQTDIGNYDIDDNYNAGSYRFLSFASDIEYFIGDSICLKYPETVYSDGDVKFTYYVITHYDNFVHVYQADENYENLDYLYTGWVKY